MHHIFRTSVHIATNIKATKSLAPHLQGDFREPHSFPNLQLAPTIDANTASMTSQILTSRNYKCTACSHQTHFNMDWWTDAGRHGSKAHAERRFSVMEPILEPGTSTELSPCVIIYEVERQESRLPTIRYSGGGSVWKRPCDVNAISMGQNDEGAEAMSHDGLRRVAWGEERKKKSASKGMGVNQCQGKSTSEGEERVDWGLETKGCS